MTARRLRAAAALALIGLAGAGCGADAPSPTAGAAHAAAQGKAVKFAACVREHGVPGFPDPDASGELTIDGVANGSSVDPSSPAFERAIDACKDLEPPGFTGRKRSPEQQSASLGFARCIREHGVKDFPDPTPDAPLVDTRRIPSTDQEGGMSILNAAMQACGRFAEALGVHP